MSDACYFFKWYRFDVRCSEFAVSTDCFMHMITVASFKAQLIVSSLLLCKEVVSVFGRIWSWTEISLLFNCFGFPYTQLKQVVYCIVFITFCYWAFQMFSSLESLWLLLQCCSVAFWNAYFAASLGSMFKKTKDSSVSIGLVVWVLWLRCCLARFSFDLLVS